MPLRIHDFAVRVKSVLGSLCGAAAEKAADARDRLLFAADRLIAKIPPEKRRLVVPAAAGAVVVLLLICIAVLLPGRDGAAGQEGPAVEYASPRRVVIPPDDLFLPDEPDFVPGVMPERERRTGWTADDVLPLWQDPLKNGEEPWRSRIEKTIDEIMESVP